MTSFSGIELGFSNFSELAGLKNNFLVLNARVVDQQNATICDLTEYFKLIAEYSKMYEENREGSRLRILLVTVIKPFCLQATKLISLYLQQPPNHTRFG